MTKSRSVISVINKLSLKKIYQAR